MVEATSTKNNAADFEEVGTFSDDEDDLMDPAMAYAMREVTAAVMARINVDEESLKLHRSTPRFANDQDFQDKFQRELELLQSTIFEKGYEPSTEVLKPASQDERDAWFAKKAALLKADAQMNHAVDISLSYKGMVVGKKMDALRAKMIEADHSLLIGEYYDKLQTLINSPLYDVLKMMPKPAVHHAHLTACASLEFLISLTYKNCVYYSQIANEFHVSEKGCNKPGFIKVNTLRQYWKNSQDFDNYLRSKMILSPGRDDREDNLIWKGFQFKFQLTFQIYNYAPFFKRILYRVTRDFIKEMVTVVEYRHIFGCLFDDDGRTLTIQEELAIFQECLTTLQLRFPLFRMKLIICGLKMFGQGHIQSQLDAIVQADSITNMVVGFDMVNEEDYNPRIDAFLEQIVETKMKLGERFQVYLHSGESYSRENTELYDAILLGTKRIGHGFGLAMRPDLVQEVKKQNICVECCPVSNKILGYVHDLRTHPVRGLLAQGVKVSISPDDHGFFDSPGVTLDYLLAYLSWDLDLADMKQLCLNSIEFAAISQEDKAGLRKFFDYKWGIFLAYVRGKY